MRTRSLQILGATMAVAFVAWVGIWKLGRIVPATPSPAGSTMRQTSSPARVTLRQIDGGRHYYASISPASSWMDEHILLGGWLEQPFTITDVKYDVSMGNNVYWNLAGNPEDTKDCGGVQPCRVDFNVIRDVGMHAVAPDVTGESGSETVAYQGSDEPDMQFGTGDSSWNRAAVGSRIYCDPPAARCGYSVARYFYTGNPSSKGTTGYPTGIKPVNQGFGKGVLFWEKSSEAEQFLRYSDTLSADSYWMTDPDLNLPSQGACALLAFDSPECGSYQGRGLSAGQRALPANYAYNVATLERLSRHSKPVLADIETGCPSIRGGCTNPVASTAAAWHALIAGARGIIWFQHNFRGPCEDFKTFYDGSDPSSGMFNCRQTSGVTLHDVVEGVSAFNHRVARLNSVLLSPFADNYVSVGSADVSVMAKRSSGGFYVFAAAGKPAMPPRVNTAVRFKVANNYTGPVAVVDEKRVLHAVDGVFTDKFANEDTVHIYRIG